MNTASENDSSNKEAVRALAGRASMIVWETGVDGRCRYLNPQAMQGLVRPEEVSMDDWRQLIHPEDARRVADTVADAMRNRREYMLEYRVRRDDGTLRRMMEAAAPRFAADGALQGYAGTLLDLSPTNDLPENSARPAPSPERARREARFRSIASLTSDWYWETDAELRLTFVSDGLYKMPRVRPADVLGSRLDAHVANANAADLLAWRQSVAERRTFRDFIYPAEFANYPGIVRYLLISGEPYSENGIFRGYRGLGRDITQEVRRARTLEQMATRDALTGLPNQTLLLSHLRQRLAGRDPGTVLAVFFIDLDAFKQVNYSLGHATGDVMLMEIARRFSDCVRAGDMVARLGGNAFVIVSACREGDMSAVRLAERLRKALEAPVMLAGHELKASASIGISMYPQDGASAEALLQNADTALHRAKACGGDTFRFYTPEMGENSRARLRMQTALRNALARNEFEVHFQPRADLETFEITGMEALLRWTHPGLGAVSPADFIPLAEESGLIEDITDWVLREATSQVHQWTVRYGRPLTISVNLSARQLRNKKVLFSVVHALRTSGLQPGQLELELTETALMEDTEMAAELLRELKALGLRLSVDDFGTGYSSLAYLASFPLDTLKLDRSFLKQKQHDEHHPWRLAEAIIKLAHTLNLSVVAEGVESEEQLAFLLTTACDEVQGSWISVPLPAARLEMLLDHSAGAPLAPAQPKNQ